MEVLTFNTDDFSLLSWTDEWLLKVAREDISQKRDWIVKERTPTPFIDIIFDLRKSL